MFPHSNLEPITTIFLYFVHFLINFNCPLLCMLWALLEYWWPFPVCMEPINVAFSWTLLLPLSQFPMFSAWPGTTLHASADAAIESFSRTSLSYGDGGHLTVLPSQQAAIFSCQKEPPCRAESERLVRASILSSRKEFFFCLCKSAVSCGHSTEILSYWLLANVIWGKHCKDHCKGTVAKSVWMKNI